MRTLVSVVLLCVVAPLSAQAPSASLLKDARDELAAAVKAHAESETYQRLQRAERIVKALMAMMDAEKAKAAKAENGSK